jgi:hypothetical protein
MEELWLLKGLGITTSTYMIRVEEEEGGDYGTTSVF